MARIRLVHWDLAGVAARAGSLRAAGHTVEYADDLRRSQTTGLGADPPDLVLIDLSRMPSHGRMVAVSLRQSGRTRRIPIAFVGGAAEKVERIRAELPDAGFVTWDELPGALGAVLAGAPRKPIVPRAATPTRTAGLGKKLGIRAGMRVCLFDAPGHVTDLLGELPPGAEVMEDEPGGDLVVWFVREAETLEAEVVERFARAGKAPVWIAWRKGLSGPGALKAGEVWAVGRAAGRGAGKICALDGAWSALQFGAPRRGPADNDDLGFDLEALRREDGRGG